MHFVECLQEISNAFSDRDASYKQNVKFIFVFCSTRNKSVEIHPVRNEAYLSTVDASFDKGIECKSRGNGNRVCRIIFGLFAMNHTWINTPIGNSLAVKFFAQDLILEADM